MSKYIARLNSSSIPPAVVHELLERVRDVGGDIKGILERAGLESRTGAFSLAYLRRRLSHAQICAIFRDCAQTLEAHIGRRAGRPAMNKAEVDLLCYCIISCSTLEQAIQRAADFCRMLGGRAGELSLRCMAGRAKFRMHTFHKERDASALLSDLTGLSTYARLFGWLIGTELAPLSVEVCYRQLLRDEVVAWLLPHPVVYRGSDNFLRFPASFLRLPVVRSTSELDDLLQEFPFDLTMTVSSQLPTSERVRVILGMALAHHVALPTTKQIAAQLGISSATLKRRLLNEHTSLQDLKNRCRHSLALDLLQDHAMPLGEIAQRLGFGDSVNFARAFRKWTGRSPSASRKTLCEKELNAAPIPPT
ncbi:MAG: hypothetical protein CMLOHMNK_00542 [Steroidobacteraceae bacterium]|nr:hypothetical protein [Steroidobacteraceae bacterium]